MTKLNARLFLLGALISVAIVAPSGASPAEQIKPTDLQQLRHWRYQCQSRDWDACKILCDKRFFWACKAMNGQHQSSITLYNILAT
jgi:hypothetical protein